jgi:hypothetical protein
MASKEQIKKVILDVAGNPSSGSVLELADKWADEIEKLTCPCNTSASWRSEKETRVTKSAEIR